MLPDSSPQRLMEHHPVSLLSLQYVPLHLSLFPAACAPGLRKPPQPRKRRALLQGSPGQALRILSQAAVSHPAPVQAKALRLQKSKFRAPRPAPVQEHGAADVRNTGMDKKTWPEPVQDSGETGSPQ